MKKKLAKTFNFSFRFIGYVLFLNDARFGDDLHLIYPNELKIQDKTENLKIHLYSLRNGHKRSAKPLDI